MYWPAHARLLRRTLLLVALLALLPLLPLLAPPPPRVGAALQPARPGPAWATAQAAQAAGGDQPGAFVLGWRANQTVHALGGAWGDLDGDGDLDLAVAVLNQPSQLYRNDGGQLLLDTAWQTPAGDGASAAAWGDYDGDGDLDLAIGNLFAPARIYRNDGGQLSSTPVWEGPTAQYTRSLAWGDYDGDDDLDLLLGNSTACGLTYEPYYSQPCPPDAPLTLYRNDGLDPAGDPLLSPAWSPRDTLAASQVAWGDLDGDGDLDLAVANMDGALMLYRNDAGLGTRPIWSSGETNPSLSIAWGDYDNDGDLDLVAGSMHADISTRIYRNTGGMLGAFAVWASPPSIENGAWSVAWGDLEGDGDLDLAVGNQAGPVTVYENDYGSFGAPLWLAPDVEQSTLVAWADLDGDGALDLTALNARQPSRIFLNRRLPISAEPALTIADPGGDGVESLAWGDLDHDGDLDLALGRRSGAVELYDNALGGLSPLPSLSQQLPGDAQVAWGDLDNDGDLDLAVGHKGDGLSSMVYQNQGGSFSAEPIWTSPPLWQTTSVAWADVNNDGFLDMVLAGELGTTLQLYHNNAAGSLEPQPVWIAEPSDAVLSLAWGDVDNDGDLDLAAGHRFIAPSLYRNEGGTLNSLPAWSGAQLGATNAVAWGDYDGDGDLDLATGSTTNPVRLYRNQAGTLEPSPIWSSNESYETGKVAWADVDNDGDLDLSAAAEPGQLMLYRNTTAGLDRRAAWRSPPGSITSLAWADYDDDGDLDLATGGYDGSALLYLNQRDQRELREGNPIVAIDRPSHTADAGAYSDPAMFTSQALPVRYTLSDPEDQLVQRIVGEYSLNGGGSWLPATPTSATLTADLQTGLAGMPYTHTLSAAPLDIPAGSPISSTILITSSGLIADIDVTVSLEHALPSDLSLWLTAPSGTRVLLSRNRGGPGAGFEQISFDQDAGLPISDDGLPFSGAYRPEESLDRLIGEEAAGWWTLSLLDTRPGETGRLSSWDLSVTFGWQEHVSNTTPTPIFEEQQAFSAIWLSGAELLADLDVTMTISHTNIRDLWIALISPNGDLNILIDHRGGQAQEFAGTILDDDAPVPISSGQAPYTGRYRPDTPLDRYNGLSPQGLWWLAISDDEALLEDEGLLVSWSLTATLQLGNLHQSNLQPLPIPDGASLDSTIELEGEGLVKDVDVLVDLAHPQAGDLSLSLRAPSGQLVLLSDLSGDGADFDQTLFDDEAALALDAGQAPFSGRYRPEQLLAHFDNQPISGPWSLEVADSGGNAGLLRSWSLVVTAKSSAVYTFTWDIARDGLMGQSDNVVFRLSAIPASLQRRGDTPPPQLYGAYASASLPFRLRGTQVRVVDQQTGQGAPNALVYRLPAGALRDGAPLIDLTRTPLRTDSQGYLAGRAHLQHGDQLLALYPVSPTLTFSSTSVVDGLPAFSLYYTNGVPNDQSLEAFEVSQGGLQTLNVSAQHPLLLFNLSISLEWDAHKDPLYLRTLGDNLRAASRHLYDFTNGQVALGQVQVFQHGDNWVYSDIVVHATNRLRPFAAEGGIVISPTADLDPKTISYDSGQVHMGATWHRQGRPERSLDGDWALVLAHELSHYLFFLEDTYLGLSPQGLLTGVSSCRGSAMGDVYNPDNSEFIFDQVFWDEHCGETLAEKELERTEWETLQRWYPELIEPAVSLAGPHMLPFSLTDVQVNDPITPSETLDDPTFFADYVGGQIASREARAFLFLGAATSEGDDDFAIELGVPTSRNNIVLARGAAPGARLCVFDPRWRQFGCELIKAGDQRIALAEDQSWSPVLQVTPITSRTLQLQVAGVAPGLELRARIYPEYGWGGPVLALEQSGAIYSATVELEFPALAGHIQLWAEQATQSGQLREAMVSFTIGGNPGFMRVGDGFMRVGDGFVRVGGGFMRVGDSPLRGNSGFMRVGDAPLLSADGQMSYLVEGKLEPEQLYALQTSASLPELPDGKLLIGRGYRLIASPALSGLPGVVTFQYLNSDLPSENEDLSALHIHYWDGAAWHVLPEELDPEFNLVSAHGRGPGVYALLLGVTTPQIQAVTPGSATRDVSTTLVISAGQLLQPLQLRLVGPTTYTPTVSFASSVSMTAVLPPGMAIGSYALELINGDGGSSTLPGAVAIYPPSSACFADGFGSGLSRWQSGGWGLVELPGGEHAITDSPGGPYAGMASNSLTSQAFSLQGCAQPLLTFRHDYILARLGSSEDSGLVEVSLDNGLSWQELARYSGGRPLYAGAAPDAASNEWNGAEWKQVRIRLPRSQGSMLLRFRLESDQLVSDAGWLIDDVAVINAPYKTFLPLME